MRREITVIGNRLLFQRAPPSSTFLVIEGYPDVKSGRAVITGETPKDIQTYIHTYIHA